MKEASIKLIDYDSGWPVKFKAEKKLLLKIIGKWCVRGIEYIGSTAVPWLIAKPVIDIMFGVGSLEVSRTAINVLVENGYQYFPYNEDVIHWLCKPSAAFRTHQLHLIPLNSQLWQQRIKYRYLLLSYKEVATGYSNLKCHRKS